MFFFNSTKCYARKYFIKLLMNLTLRADKILTAIKSFSFLMFKIVIHIGLF